MQKNKRKKPSTLHFRNRNLERYNLEAMIEDNPQLEKYTATNLMGDTTIDFANPKAVKLLNQIILKHYYGIQYWDFPNANLCPPIPGRADYIHYLADILAEYNEGKIPKGNNIRGLDIGVGANCIYPILGHTEYGWSFVGSDTVLESVESARNIVANNESLKNDVEIRHQKNADNFFQGIVKSDEKFEITLCNPPFHASLEDALRGTRRKVKNLTGEAVKDPTKNFSGIHQELIYEGGEIQFIKNLIKESKAYAKQCLWFTTLVSKKSNLVAIDLALSNIGVKLQKTITLGVGNKTSRIVAWSYLSKKDHKEWLKQK